jgi:hypothetical protein
MRMGGIIGSLFAIKIYPLSIDPSSGRDDLAALRGPEPERVYFDGKQRSYDATHEVGNPVFGFTEEIAVPYGALRGPELSGGGLEVKSLTIC